MNPLAFRGAPTLDPAALARLAQLDRASASGAEGHRFESCRARHLEGRSPHGRGVRPAVGFRSGASAFLTSERRLTGRSRSSSTGRLLGCRGPGALPVPTAEARRCFGVQLGGLRRRPTGVLGRSGWPGLNSTRRSTPSRSTEPASAWEGASGAVVLRVRYGPPGTFVTVVMNRRTSATRYDLLPLPGAGGAARRGARGCSDAERGAPGRKRKGARGGACAWCAPSPSRRTIRHGCHHPG